MSSFHSIANGRLEQALATAMSDPERMARLFGAAEQLSSAESVDELLKRFVHAARSLTCADGATLKLLGSESPRRLVWAGPGGGAACSERELCVTERPFACLRVATSRPRLTPYDEALLDLLTLHAENTIEKIMLRAQEDVLEQLRAVLGEAENGAAENGTVREVGDLRIDLARYQVVVGAKPVHLTPSEFRLLELLTEEPGRAYTRREIVGRLWDTPSAVSPRVADTHVARLRRKIERDRGRPERLVQVRGVGYKLVPQAE